MQTLIKWPGGKSSELKIIKKFIPQFTGFYVEPFFGGGALFFDVLPTKAIINDISSNLMSFYSYIKSKNAKFKCLLYDINEEWNLLKTIANSHAAELIVYYLQFKNCLINKEDLFSIIKKYVVNTTDMMIKSSCLIFDEDELFNQLYRMLSDKMLRTIKNEVSFNKDLSKEDLLDNIITGFASGYYMYMRTILNKIENLSLSFVADEFKTAVFYFVREFCYGSMFRYNKKGEFNIPYGGIAYNNKDFKKKIDLIFSNKIYKVFKSTEIYSKDFETILKMINPNDFIFLDPPYDSDFSDYEDKSFGKEEHIRLAKCLHNISAKFLLIIKNTPLIEELYRNNGYKIFAFDNKYSYCVKGRNDRNAEHLIITNYDVNNIS